MGITRNSRTYSARAALHADHLAGLAVSYGVIVTAPRCLGGYGVVAVVSGMIPGQTETATLRVKER